MRTTRSSKKPLIIFVIIALLGAAFVLALKYGRHTDPVVSENIEQVNVEGVGTPAGTKPTSGVGTLRDLAKDGKDKQCQIVEERSATEGNIEGTFFTSKGNSRGDFMVPAAEFGGKILSSVIVGGNSMYVWSTIDNNTFGFKSAVSGGDSDQIDTKEPVPLDEPIKYSCTDWNEVDGSVFVPPANITFKDLNAVIEAGMEDGRLPARGEF